MENDRAYLDYRVRQFSRQSQKAALKLGLLLWSFTAISFTLIYFVPGDLIDILVLAGIGGVVTLFGVWSLSLMTVTDTIEFVQELNREHQEAMARS